MPNSSANFRYSLRDYFLAFLCGLLLTLGFAPFENFFAVIASFSSLLYLFEQTLLQNHERSANLNRHLAANKAFWLGYFFGFGHFISSLYWIAHPLTLDLPSYWALLPLALGVAPAVSALFTGLAFYLTCLTLDLVASRRKIAVIVNIKQLRLYTVLFLSFFWPLCELMRGYMLLPFPWNFLGYVSGFSLYFLQNIALFGVSGFSAIIIWLASGLYLRNRLNILCLLSLFTFLNLYGYLRIQLFDWKFADNTIEQDQPNTLEKTEKVVRLGQGNNLIALLLIQPNAGPKILSHEAKIVTEFQELIATTDAAANRPLMLPKKLRSKEVVSIILWPESAIPMLLNSAERDLPILREISQGNTWLFSGVDRVNNSTGLDERFYNSSILLHEGRIVASYNKRVLVPFGEYIPLYSLLRRWLPPVVDNFGFTPGEQAGFTYNAATDVAIEQSTDFGATDILMGQGAVVAALSRNKFDYITKFAPYICSEIIFPRWFLSNINKNTEIIVNITNDVWFGNTSGPYQHLAIARARAVELGLPLLRVSNNGISAVVDKFGRFAYQSELNKAALHRGLYIF